MADVQYYTAPISVRQTAASAANTTIWSMRNPTGSTKLVMIEGVKINMSFDTATPLTRALLRWDFVRFSAATPTAGTTITPVSLDSSYATSQVTDIRFLDTGLTITSVSFGTPIFTVGCPATDSIVVNYESSDIKIVLNPGEGLCIRLNVASVIGQGMTGFINWSER